MKIPPTTSITASQREILGLNVCDLGWADALAFADELLSMPIGQTVVSFLNANNANLMMKNPDYRVILERQLVFPDGYGVDIASWMRYGSMFPANLNGTDFVPALLTYVSRPLKVAMIGARPEVLARAAEAFRQHAPWHEFIPVSDGFFAEEESDAVMAKVRDVRPDLLLIAMGSPKQEKWVDTYVGPGHARLVMTVGALFDFVGGAFPRAPAMVRRLRLEWLYRLVQEPSRLWRRYLLGNPLFLLNALRHSLLGGEPGRLPEANLRR
ncbi:WecB/TagA/CpsF family glycosyltransferase [Rhizobium sp. SG2393]|uniref:WecB/TagA/CpsF family glycosyltransferase n=1 Tax=Rhizobium sp. SG2393 TaxID=3276279 RepID=UPI003670EA6E